MEKKWLNMQQTINTTQFYVNKESYIEEVLT